MLSKKLITAIAIIWLTLINCQAQNCNISIKGLVSNEVTESPLSFVNVFEKETYKGAITNDKGLFALDSLCADEYLIRFSYIGYETKKINITLTKDTILNIQLKPTASLLETIVIEGQKNDLNYQASTTVNRQTIEDNANKNLAALLENETGVHLIKNGSGVAKPVVHGLFGNRLLILNNGIAQSGQQWGNDHSPEIDPFTAEEISVIKGANALEYGGGNLGSVVLIKPKKITKEPNLHGQVNYAFETNGNGHNLSTRLEKYSNILAWKVVGTLKKYGDKKTADYYLNNTGIEEANLSLQLEKTWKGKLFVDFYASTFNTKIGVLRGSHIGNLTDLEAALNRDVPFYTEPNFSYNIDAPKQLVSHHLVKLKSKYSFNEKQVLELVLATQINNRKEFDVRRSGRTDIPALSLLQYTFNVDTKYKHTFTNNWKLKLGSQHILTDNTNNPETGVLPLIPDYRSFKSGIFSTLSKTKNNSNFNFGMRYDFETQQVLTISNTLPRVIIQYRNNFHNLSGLFSYKYNLEKAQTLAFNTGFTMRNPAVNELYSNGLHQGVSGIEEGDINLKTEKALKNTLEYKWFPNGNFTLNALAYHQYFKDYIFLNPQEEIRLTIRGAFPVFKYEQTNASIYGLDISAQFKINNSFKGLVQYSYIKGDDIKNNIPLIFMPPNSLFGSLRYNTNKSIKLFGKTKVEELEIEVNNKLVFKQNNILDNQDFIQPPPMYNLLGLKISANINSPKHKLRCFVKAENLLNTQFRDYLNRQRYFADDVGISITTGVSFKF